MKTVITRDEWQSVMWRNGLGLTNVIWPQSSAAEIGIQLHRTPITASVPFSSYAGQERIFTLVSGPRLLLIIEGEAIEVLPFQPVRFAGEAQVVVQVSGETAIEVFNIIYDREKWHEPDVTQFSTESAFTIGHAVGGDVVLTIEDENITLGDGDTLLTAGLASPSSGAGECLRFVLEAISPI